MKSNVMLTGSFDGDLHEGHLNLLRFAAQYGRLYVVIAPDWHIRRKKNRDPIHSQTQRALNVLNTGLVTGVVLHGDDEQENLEMIQDFMPDVYVFGEDQGITEFIEWNNQLEEILKKDYVQILRCPKTPGISTTLIYDAK